MNKEINTYNQNHKKLETVGTCTSIIENLKITNSILKYVLKNIRIRDA